jgi:3'-5' exoribonuclease-like protein
MRYFLDTEFDENGTTIKLISIALVAENGRELYLVSNEFVAADCNEWVAENVLPKLPPRADSRWLSRRQIRDAVVAMIGTDPDPEIWGYFADYDWVVFCQLFGRMVDLPKGFPMYCMDLKQWAKQCGVKIKEAVPQPPGMHDALVDARWVRDAHAYLYRLSPPRTTAEGQEK